MARDRVGLQAGEAVLAQAKIHWVSYAPGAMLLVIGAAVAVGAVLAPLQPNAEIALFAVGALVGGYGALRLGWVALQNAVMVLAVTNRKVVVRSGVFDRLLISQRLEKVDSVVVQQTLLGRIFGYGTVTIHGSGVSTTPLPHISAPMRFKRSVDAASAAAETEKG